MIPACGADNCDTCPDRLVCRCLQVTESQLIETITTKDARTLREIRCHTGAGDGCTACHTILHRFIEQYA